MKKTILMITGCILLIMVVALNNQSDNSKDLTKNDYYTDKTQFNFSPKDTQLDSKITEEYNFNKNTDNKTTQNSLIFQPEQKNIKKINDQKEQDNTPKSENSILITSLIVIGVLILVLLLANIRRKNGKTW